jgi:hypothetical protein
MKKWFLAAGVTALAMSLIFTPAFTQDAVGTKKETAKSDDGAKPKRAEGRRALKTNPADGKIISPYSLAQRAALNRQDCKPNNLQKDGLGIHGHYRTYGQWDPELKSIEGRKQYEACVKRGLEPTPWFAFGQRALIATRGQFFGKTRDDCLKCHSNY